MGERIIFSVGVLLSPFSDVPLTCFKVFLDVVFCLFYVMYIFMFLPVVCLFKMIPFGLRYVMILPRVSQGTCGSADPSPPGTATRCPRQRRWVAVRLPVLVGCCRCHS